MKIKNVKLACGIKYKYCDCFLVYTDFKDDLMEYKCLLCNKNRQRKFDEKLKERVFKTYKFSRFIELLLRGSMTKRGIKRGSE